MSYLGAGLGAAAVVDPRIEFQTKFADLMGRINGAIMAAASRGATPAVLQTMSNNVAALGRIKDQVLAGDLAKAEQVRRVGEALLAEARQYSTPTDYNVMEGLIQSIASLPARFASTVESVARATGKTVKAVAEGAGVNPELLVAQAGNAVKYGALAAVALAAIYLARR